MTKLPLFVIFIFSILPVEAQLVSIDVSQDQQVIGGRVLFGGWGMDSQTPISRVELFVDSVDVASADYGGFRPDACRAIGNWPSCPNVAWASTLNTAVYADGPHLLTVTLTTSDNRRSSMVRPFIVNNNESVPLDSLTLYRLTNVDTQHKSANQLWSVIPTPSGTFVFESINTGRSLGVPFGKNGGESTVVQDPYYGAAEQEWILVAAGGGYVLYNKATKKVLGIDAGATSNSARLETTDYSGALSQQWYLTPEPNPPSDDGGHDGQGSLPANHDLISRSETDAGHDSSGAMLADSVTWMSDPKLKPLLSEPGGLERAARLVGRLATRVNDTATHNLTESQLLSQSTAVILGKVVSKKSNVDPRTNLFNTEMTVQVDEWLKGSTARTIVVRLFGGLYIYDANVFAEVLAVQSHEKDIGTELLIFLNSPGSSGMFSPVNGLEGLYSVDVPSGMVTSFTADDFQQHLLSRQPQLLSLFRKRLKAIATASLGAK